MKILAYLDAGTGSIIIQAVIGASVAIAVFAKTYWHKIVKFNKRNTSKDSKDFRDKS